MNNPNGPPLPPQNLPAQKLAYQNPPIQNQNEPPENPGPNNSDKVVKEVKVNDMVVTVWFAPRNKKKKFWYKGFVTDMCENSENEIEIDHLHPTDIE